MKERKGGKKEGEGERKGRMELGKKKVCVRKREGQETTHFRFILV